MSFKQRVPIGTVQGIDVYITVEWLRELTNQFAALQAETSTGTVTQAQITAISSLITSLTAALAALTARVTKLEGGFQS